jgi:hypothetical protein
VFEIEKVNQDIKFTEIQKLAFGPVNSVKEIITQDLYLINSYSSMSNVLFKLDRMDYVDQSSVYVMDEII